MSRGFLVNATVDLAIVADGPFVSRPQRATPMSDRALAAVTRIGRTSHDVRDALGALLEVVAMLERRVERTTRLLVMRDAGVVLQPFLVLVGADGLALGVDVLGPFRDATAVVVHLALDVQEQAWLVTLRAQVEPDEDGAFLRFLDVRPHERDLLVAFTFQHELRERRRAVAGS